MTIKEVLAEADLRKKIQMLKNAKGFTPPSLGDILKYWDPVKHDINDAVLRPDKAVSEPRLNAEGVEVEGEDIIRYQSVVRVALAIQKLIVKKAAAFIFGNPVKIKSDKEESVTAKAVNQILKDNKINSVNKQEARILFCSTEVAEYWYGTPVSESYDKYGFKTKTKFRVKIFSPLAGDKLYPYFSASGEMVAFSREYTVKEVKTWYIGAEDVTYFETWTADTYTRWRQDGGNWVKVDFEDPEFEINKTGKIPIIYGQQDETEYADVQNLIDRLEVVISNLGDTNDYNASPIAFAKGDVTGMPRKGEAGKFFSADSKDADLKYVSWEQAPESVKLELETLFKMVWMISQTPDLSFESLKGMGTALSGEGMKVALFDAELKVMDHLEVFDEFHQRRLNLLKAFVQEYPAAANEDVELTPVFQPYMPVSQADTISNINSAVAGKLLSLQTGRTLTGLTDDPKHEGDLIIKEQEAEDKRAADQQNALNAQFNN